MGPQLLQLDAYPSITVLGGARRGRREIPLYCPASARVAPGHNGYPHAPDLIRVKAREGRLCHQITDATVGPFLHLLNPTRRPRQESKLDVVVLSVLLSVRSRCNWSDACFVIAALHQNIQNNPRQLVSEAS
jgi:hypothetical protein